MRCPSKYTVFSFSVVIFLFAASMFAWSLGQESYRVAFSGAGLFMAAWLVITLSDQLHL
ncbi:MAG: hypothetical protein ACMXYD_05685 [Candidatus Woesearchaeota archaeon]